MKKGIVYIFILLLAASCSGPKPKPPGDSVAGAAPDGQVVYEDNCVLCHGGDGSRGTGGASDLAVSVLDHGGLLNVITNGRGGMKAYSAILTPQEIEAVATYVETLRKNK
jgi:mono/diheme cytochrome c family protein